MIVSLFGGVGVLHDLISDWTVNIGVSITALYVSGYFLGKWLDFSINEKKRSPILFGSMCLYLVLFFGVISGATIGFIQDGIEQIITQGNIIDAIIDYYFKPLYWVLLVGFIPTLISGILLGYSIQHKTS